ncbi:hypothetical protein LINGRAHAP2_LOCUS24767 [Linum grandiflorum]
MLSRPTLDRALLHVPSYVARFMNFLWRGIRVIGKSSFKWTLHVLLLFYWVILPMMQDTTPAFERRASFWLASGKFLPPIFIEKATLLRISLLIMSTLLVLAFMFSYPFLVMF